MNTDFNVLEMAQAYAEANNTNTSDLFKKPKAKFEDPKIEEVQIDENNQISPVKKQKTPWVPDEKLIEGMNEFTSDPVTYDKKDLEVNEDGTLKNIIDEDAKEESREAMDEMSRKYANIEDAKKRHGIVNFQIPEGEYHALIFAAAGDTNYKRAQDALDEIFNEIKSVHPEFIRDWAEGYPKNESSNISNVPTTPAEEKVTENIEVNENIKEETAAVSVEPSIPSNNNINEEMPDGEDVKVIINKTDLPNVSWTEEDISKIRKSRSIELNIVENQDLEYTNIEEVDPKWVDAVLMPYQRKSNDIVAALPASKYRATFTGLTYTEVIDLSNSTEMNTIDGERKKWSICFNHIKNQSIGPWEEYILYIDPMTRKTMRISLEDSDKIPENVDPETIHKVSKFEDFLRKTSFMDLEYMLWKILCATTMDQEIIQIDCHAIMDNGKDCGNHYDWIYSPTELLDMSTINPAVLEEIEKTATVSGKDIMDNYNSSMLRLNNTAKLHTSGISVVFGHISAYEYLDSVYEKIQSLDNEEEYNDPTIASRSLNYATLSVVKAFLIPKENGGFIRITGADNILKVINTLDEIDWQTLAELVRIMLEPYEFKYSMRDIVCPKCKNRSNIPINSMAKLLFIVARSLSSVNVVLKKI